MAALSTNEVADYFIYALREAGEPVTNLKLQKLLYYAQAWYLTLNNGEALFDARIEAWVHGPVVPEVYRRFREYSWQPIQEDITKPELSTTQTAFLDEVLNVFGGLSAFELERTTHSEKPWLEARGNIPLDQSSNAEITHSSMIEYCRSMQNESN